MKIGPGMAVYRSCPFQESRIGFFRCWDHIQGGSRDRVQRCLGAQQPLPWYHIVWPAPRKSTGQLDLIDDNGDLMMSVDQLFVPSHMFHEQQLHDLVVFCWYTNLRLRGSYLLLHMQQLWALSAITSTQFNRIRWGAMVDMIPFFKATSTITEQFHHDEYLLNAKDEGTFVYPYQFMPSRKSVLARASAGRLPIDKLWNVELPAVSKAGILMAFTMPGCYA